MGDLRYSSKALRDPIHIEADSLTFGLYSGKEVLSLSTVHVTNPVSFNQLGHPLEHGLYDLRMGPYSDRDNMTCTTCHLNSEHCPGHIGHIELPMPVVNSLFYNTILRLLKITCLHCHKFKMPEYCKTLFLIQQKLLDAGMINAAQTAGEIAERKEDREEKKKGVINQAEDLAMNVKLQEFAEAQLSGSDTQAFSADANTRSIEQLRKEYGKKLLLQGKESTCPQCGTSTKRITLYKSRFIYEGTRMVDTGDNDDDVELDLMGVQRRTTKGGEREKSEMNPTELRDHFRSLFSQDHELIGHLFPVMKRVELAHPTDVLFLDVLPVPPPRVRPVQFTGGLLTQHPQSQALQHVVETVALMKPLVKVMQGQDVKEFGLETQEMLKSLRGENTSVQLDLVWKELQNHVDHVIDRDMNATRNQKIGWGFKQLIERKQGLFRMHMMGKRVNYACRTVICPDPNIGTDEIGLPEIFAKKLNYQVPVTPWNVGELREMVLNGPNVHPGCVMVENEFGQKTVLDENDRSQREGIAKTLLTPSYEGAVGSGRPKIVYRHLKNGDAMLLNRQPTLHKPGILALRARVLKGEKVMRLHYSNCKSFNADFDGDEMNAHFPQSEVARAEAYNLVSSSRNFLVPKDGTPLQGLIQDHVIAAVKMSLRGRFFTRGEYQQLVFGGLVDFPGRIKLFPPAIIKPEELWSGKQVISTVITNLVPKNKRPPNLASNTKIKPKEWISCPPRPWKAGGGPLCSALDMTESEFIVRNGELCCGILDKQQFGPTPYSLVMLYCELYGGDYSAKLLSAFSKMFTNFIRSEGFSLGVEDIIVTKEANAERAAVMARTEKVGNSCAATGVGIKGDFTEEELKIKLEAAHRASAAVPKRRMDIDRGFKAALNPATNEVNACCLPAGLIKKFPQNNLQLMVNTGAKGSSVNTMQISCLLGQIELEGKRPPIMISGRSLPSFKPYDTQPRAGGFIDGRFMTGIQPQEFFFHCMAGREGLIDTACKTSRSGYLQRCLIKLLEGLVVGYDMTVRESDGSVIQFKYGEDSMDTCKAQYIKKGKLEYLAENMESAYYKEDVARAKAVTDLKGLKKAKKEVKKWKKKHPGKRGRNGTFLEFCKDFGPKLSMEGYGQTQVGKGENDLVVNRSKSSMALVDAYTSIPDSQWQTNADIQKFITAGTPCPPPVTDTFYPSCHFGSLTEKVDSLIEEYISSREKSGKALDNDQFRDMMYMKAQQATVCAGEPVGIIAAQSVGEPSTQMTLNTFHFAGRGEMNVTLGIPRLREILMVASANIKTPSMDIPFREGVGEKEMDRMRLKFNRVLIADLLERVVVTEKTQLKPSRAKIVELRFQFLPHKNYKQNFGVKPSQVLQYFEKKFIMKVLMPVMAAITKQKSVTVESGTDGDERARKSGGGDDDMSEAGERGKKQESAADRVMGDVESSDEEEVGEGEGTDMTRRVERQGDREYEEMEEEEIDMNREIDKELGDEYIEEDEDSKNEVVAQIEDDEGLGEEFEDDDGSTSKISQEDAMGSGEPARRRAEVLRLLDGRGGIASIVDYSYDTEKQSWATLTLSFDIAKKGIDMSQVLRVAANKAVVYEVKNIKKSFVLEDKGKMILKTEGINIDAIFHYGHILDITSMACNNIHDMARYYGIEAANQTIVREITGVFSVYGIEVDKRHLSLIADFMTFDGTYKPFNRVGIENNASPLQQMTFETAMGFLRSATLGGKTDNLSSPSACVVLGKPTRGGTGSFSLMQRLS